MPQPEEFARENQFRVELPDAQRLYYALDHAYQVEPGTFMPVFKIGTSHSEDELFSQINIYAMVLDNTLVVKDGYSISAELKYQNPDYQYWQKGQVEQLQKLLNDSYGYNSVDHQMEKDCHTLIIKDFDAELLYVLGLGTEDEGTLWKRQVEEADQMIKDTIHPYHPFIKPAAEQALFSLVNSLHANPTVSHIEIKLIDADPNAISYRDLFPSTIDVLVNDPEEIRAFTNTTQKWAKFIEDAVNTMSKVKGILQSGKLTLLPPSEIPQV